MKVYTLQDNNALMGAFSTINKLSWPNFLLEGSEPIPFCWATIMSEFANIQLILTDDTGIPMAVANSVPINWDGTHSGLPEGWDDAVLRAITGLENDEKPNTLTALSITISPEHKGTGLSYIMLNAFKEAARKEGYQYLIVPVRPSLKSLYALTPMEKYITWRDDKQQHFDPWLRTHIKSGGCILKICDQSMSVKASIAKWENWTGLKFPSSGKYIIPKALNPIDIIVEEDMGLYIEPNVWIQHDLTNH